MSVYFMSQKITKTRWTLAGAMTAAAAGVAASIFLTGMTVSYTHLDVYKRQSHFMVNGSTGGILSAIAGVTHRGDRVLVARNCHTSVYHGIELNGLRPVYLWPELDRELGIYGGITREMVEAMLETYPDIRAVIFTSPTYEGLLSDVRGICDAAHARGIPCIVDEAHGAHLRWIGIPDSVSPVSYTHLDVYKRQVLL